LLTHFVSNAVEGPAVAFAVPCSLPAPLPTRYHRPMKLIFLYGLPAVGKLTVAKELASATSFKLFHNHLAVDLLLSVFDFGTPPFVELREQIWLSYSIEPAERSSPVSSSPSPPRPPYARPSSRTRWTPSRTLEERFTSSSCYAHSQS
jgi:hypothetical protein